MITLSHEIFVILFGFVISAGMVGWQMGYNAGRINERAEKLREMLEAADCPECRIS